MTRRSVWKAGTEHGVERGTEQRAHECGHHHRLPPGSENVAVCQVNGVRVTAQADAWTGSPTVTDAVGPVRITINNRGTSAKRVRYRDFALVAPSGRRYAALSPFKVEGERMSPALATSFFPIASPAFVYFGYYFRPSPEPSSRPSRCSGSDFRKA